MVSRFEPVLSENRYRMTKWSFWSKSFWSFSFRGLCFQCHYINIMLYFIVSWKESVKSFLTLMTHDLNDQLRTMTMTITMTAIRIEAINLHKVWSFSHWSLWSFSFSISLPPINHKLYTINLHHKCRKTDDGPSGKVLQNQAKCRTFALATG